MSRGPLNGCTTLSFGAGRANGQAAAPTLIQYNDGGLARDRPQGLAGVLETKWDVNFYKIGGGCLWHSEMNITQSEGSEVCVLR